MIRCQQLEHPSYQVVQIGDIARLVPPDKVTESRLVGPEYLSHSAEPVGNRIGRFPAMEALVDRVGTSEGSAARRGRPSVIRCPRKPT